jgi:nucleoside-diphosphate-sugar epimerase
MNKPALTQTPARRNKILLTGATGYVGSLILTSLLLETEAKVVVLVRDGHTMDGVLEPVEIECEAQGVLLDAARRGRVQLLPLPSDLTDLRALASSPECNGIDEVIHCAGCVDYFDTERLQLVNVTFTKALLNLSMDLGIARFVYISTAYSSGYRENLIGEGLHATPDGDPTEYTRTKRDAEHLVAASGLPYLILRPSILIGHSATGRYSGKRYGLYQQWMGLERLICNRYHEEFHTVAPRMPLNLIHQDAFQSAFIAAHRYVPDGAIVHIVSKEETSPSMRDLWDMWMEVTRPKKVLYYPTVDDVPLQRIHTRQRAYLTFAKVNLEIAAHRWQFEAEWLEQLRAQGLHFPDVTGASVRQCQDRFVRSSETMQEYLRKNSELLADDVCFTDVDTSGLLAAAM